MTLSSKAGVSRFKARGFYFSFGQIFEVYHVEPTTKWWLQEPEPDTSFSLCSMIPVLGYLSVQVQIRDSSIKPHKWLKRQRRYLGMVLVPRRLWASVIAVAFDCWPSRDLLQPSQRSSGRSWSVFCPSGFLEFIYFLLQQLITLLFFCSNTWIYSFLCIT